LKEEREETQMAGLTPAHLLIILVIALIVIGPGKLPEVGAAIGKSFKEFQKAVGPMQEAASALTNPLAQLTQPAPPAATPPAAQPIYAAPVAPVVQPPVQYQPVMGVVEAAPAQPAPIQPAPIQPALVSDPQADATSLPNTPKVG
jgi:TatA/E family protein of Tat protein translocase